MLFRNILLTALAGLVASTAQAEPDHVVAAHYPPLMIANNDERPGASVEIIQEAARRLGRELRIEFLPFRRAIKTVQRGRNILQPSLFRKPERESKYAWVIRTHDLRNTFNSIGSPINTLDEGRALEWVGVEKDSALDVLLTGAGFTNLSHVDRPQINAQKLMNGRIDAWALPHVVALEVWNSMGYTETLVAGQALAVEQNYIVASPNSDPEFIQAYRNAVDSMRDDGTLNAILEKYGWTTE